jgi:hypothetical protein
VCDSDNVTDTHLRKNKYQRVLAFAMPAPANGPANEGAGDLFDDLIYYLSPSLAPDHSRVVRAIMNKNGAKEAQRKDIRSATHIISESHSLEKLEFGEVGLRDDVAIVTVSELKGASSRRN